MSLMNTLYGYLILEDEQVTYCSPQVKLLMESKGSGWILDHVVGDDLPTSFPYQDQLTVTIDRFGKNRYIAIFQTVEKWQELLDANRDLEMIFNNSHDGIYVTDGKGNTIRVNRGSERNFGLSASELVGRNVYDLEREGVFRPSVVRRVLEERKRVTVYQETQIGKVMMATGNPLFNEEGEIVRVICNSRDITELTHLREQLKLHEEKVKRYESELQELRQREIRIDGFIANSQKMRDILALLQRVAPVDSNILITGESGTGKEVLAKAVHSLSHRSKGPFIKVNCGAIPENLLESELFGYESGAFTGAKKGGKPGYFELADKGTLFLDEIGELPLSLQAKLLQAIQDKAIQPVGGVKTVKVDFRLIAATNRNLQDMVDQGKFREDLFYRLNVIPIHIPPLRERKEDIPFLIHYFVDKFNRLYNMKKRFDSKSFYWLTHYEWPGNIRQLQNVVERLIVVSESDIIQSHKIMSVWEGENKPMPDFKQEMAVGPEGDPKMEGEEEPEINLKEVLKEVEKQYIQKALKRYKSTRKAARYLKISQPTLMRRLKELNILVK